MSTATINDLPAFPTENAHQSGNSTYHYEGMSLRDYFAARALAALIAEPSWGDDCNPSLAFQLSAPDAKIAPAPMFASSAYVLADAMLAERIKEQNT